MTTAQILATLTILVLATACDRGETATASGAPPPRSGQAASAATSTDLQLTVDGTGYHPSSLSAPPGKPVRLTITRKSDEGCGQQFVLPSLNIRRDLPLNQPVTVEFTMPSSGSIAFTCGMDMLRGAIVAG